MIIPSNIRPFWDEFLTSIDFDASSRFYEVFHFDDNEATADFLAELVLKGTKRATASLLWVFEAENKLVPKPGDLSVVTNWASEPLCIIESTVIDIVPYNKVTEKFAATEGEGDESLRYWLEVHWDYFGRACQRIGREPSLEMPVICEQFEVIYPLSK
ncbi:MAG: hypothetical protein ACI9EW_003390 [Cellvibrionaceae bacterium]|jgi:uncharacterized protein YhfF